MINDRSEVVVINGKICLVGYLQSYFSCKHEVYSSIFMQTMQVFLCVFQ